MHDDSKHVEKGESTATAETNASAADPGGCSRRTFLRASACAGAVALGATGSASAATTVREKCGSYGTIPIDGGEFQNINNDWGASVDNGDVTQCVFENSDGSYGWHWDRGGSGNINYPQALVGGKPWGTKTNTSILPKRWGDVDELELQLDVDNQVSDGGNWDLAEEFWVTRNKPDGADVSNSIKNEIMLVLEWGEGHSHGGVNDPGAITDKYGNTIDYWTHYSRRWSFYIFRIAANETPDKVDLTSIMEYLEANGHQGERFSDDHWVSGIELGNENWPNTAGRTVINNFDVRVNGTVAASGVDDSWDGGNGGDAQAPPTPTGLTQAVTGQTSVTLDWNGVTDSGGSGLDHYLLRVGDRRTTVAAGTTRATVAKLSPDTSYDVSLVAVDGVGNRSDPATATVRTDARGSGEVEPIVEGKTPRNVDSDPAYEDLNANGKVDFDDVVIYFDNMDRAVMTDHAAAYDYNGNGGIDFDDVVALFGEVN